MTDDHEDSPAPEAEMTTGQVRRFRASMKDGKRAERELAVATRELAFLRAGVPDAEHSKLGALFRRGYGGDLANIAEAWAEVAPAPVTATPVALLDEDGYPVEEQAPGIVFAPGEVESTSLRSALASAGGSTERSWAPDPRDEASAAARRVVDGGGSEEAGLAASFDTLAKAAAKGDGRVLITRARARR